MHAVTRFATPRREVWLTIDDGPEPATTQAMLDLLERHNARATGMASGEVLKSQRPVTRSNLGLL